MAAVMDSTKLTYQEVLQVIKDTYGDDAFLQAASAGNYEDYIKLCQNAGIDVTVSKNGNILGYSQHITGSKSLSSTEGVAESFNSNLQTGTHAVENLIPYERPIQNVVDDAGKISSAGKLTKFTNGVKGVLNTPVAGKITPYIMAASTGIQLGKTIDSTIYDIGKAMGANPPEELNPETWNSITADMSDKGLEGIDKWAFNTILGLNPDTGEATMYADENAFAYMAQWLQGQGMFSPKYIGSRYSDTTGYSAPGGYQIVIGTSNEYGKDGALSSANFSHMSVSYKDGNYPKTQMRGTVYKDGYNTYHMLITAKGDDISNLGYGLLNDTRVYATTIPDRWENIYYATYDLVGVNILNDYQLTKTTGNILGNIRALVSALWNANYTTEENVPGISTQPDSTTPDLSTASTLEEILDLLKNTYPELWDNAVQQDVMQPDGTTKTYTYVPLPMPTEGEGSQVGTTGAVQNKSTVTPDNSTESQLSTLIKILTNSQNQPQGMTKTLPENAVLNPTTNPNPPTGGTGTGATPPFVPPVGKASSLYAIYNPSLSQINEFGSWLWSDNFVDQIKKLFNDPMQAIIGLHKVYATPATSGTGNIKVGYLDSGVSSKLVSEQYTTVNCGTVSLSEYFGNVFDYSPYTEVQLYLPFIGIVNLDTADVMRSKITVTYHVDVLTGACLAEVKVIRDAAGGTLYQYAGNAAVTLPISSGSYMGIVASIASIAGGVAGTIASGGAAAPMLIGAAGSALNARTKVEHSGGFSGNAGAMGIKIPYLIISRPQSVLASNYQDFVGNPSNETVVLSSCNGYIKVKEVHLENIPATEDELTQIENSLKEGVLL